MITAVICFSCQTSNPVLGRVGRGDDCRQCGQDLHCCKNCRFYDEKAYNECQETSAEVVREKERSNFCDYFEPGNKGHAQNQRDQLLAQAEALFKKKG